MCWCSRWACAGPGQIAELCAIAAPDVGVITNVGPVHVELLGSVEAIAAAKAEIIDGLRPGGTAVVPAEPGPLEPHLERAPKLLRFGAGGDVEATWVLAEEGETDALVRRPEGEQAFKLPFVEAHNLDNALAAIAAGVALGFPLAEMADRAPGIVFSRLRGELVELPENAILINDSYNANPISMRAALDHLATLEAGGRRLAVLGEMRELGPDAAAYHREIGEHARERGVELIIGVGDLAAAYEPDQHVADADAAADALAAALRPGRRGPGQGLEGGRPGARGREAGGALDARRDPDRRDGRDAALHLPRPEVHRVPAPAGVRAADPRGGARGAPREGRHPDDGRPADLHRRRGPVPGALGPRHAEPRGLRRGDRLRR